MLEILFYLPMKPIREKKQATGWFRPGAARERPDATAHSARLTPQIWGRAVK